MIPSYFWPGGRLWLVMLAFVGAGAVLAEVCLLYAARLNRIAIDTAAWQVRLEHPRPRPQKKHLPVAIAGALMGLLLFAIVNLAALANRHAADPEHRLVAICAYAVLSVPAILGAIWASMTVYVGLTRRHTEEDDREWWARASAWIFWISLGWIGFSLAVLAGPWLLLASPRTREWGSMAGALGLATSAYGYWSKHGTRIERKLKSIAGVLGNRLLETAAGAFIVALIVVLSLVDANLIGAAHPPAAFIRDAPTYTAVISTAAWWRVVLVMAALALAGYRCSRFVGANTFSLHSMYGNRLVRAYLGASNGRRDPNPFTDFDPNDNIAMSAVGQPAPPASASAARPRLFHVIDRKSVV